jgi:hypothetical protein
LLADNWRVYQASVDGDGSFSDAIPARNTITPITRAPAIRGQRWG